MEPVIRTVVLLLVVLTASAAAAVEPLWPLDLPTRYLTSNFMEFRPGRFHAGIDLKTDGTVGFPVHAAEDGWIARIRLSPRGYGQVVYLTGDSGRTYVYAHLDRLADPWRALARAEQERRGDWSVSLFFPPDRHRVRRGEVLALSGQSGTTGPHLHFEVRDPGDVPVDPQACGFAVEDVLPPRILSLRVLPAAPDARVAGGTVSRVATTPADGVSDLPPLTVYGQVAFTAAVLERTDAAGHRLAPWRLAVTLDDSLVFESRNERFTFDAQRSMRLEWLETPEGRERWLYRRPGNELPGRIGGDWSFDPTVLRPGPHRLVVQAEDRAGNFARYGLDLTVASAPDALPEAPGWREAPLGIARDDGAVQSPFLLHRSGGIEPAGPEPVIVTTDSLDAGEAARAWLEQGLSWAGWSVRVASPDWTLLEPRALNLDRGGGLLPAADAGVYVQNGAGEWRLAAGVRIEDGIPYTDLDGPGRYALFLDQRAPYLGPGPEEGLVGPGPPPGDPAVTPPVWAVLRIRAEDRGAGVDTGSLRAEWDGRRLPVEPDPLRLQILVEPPDDAAPGPHTLLLTVQDRAGRPVARRYDLILAR